MRVLNLNKLKEGLPGITPVISAFYMEAAIVSLTKSGFQSGVHLKVDGAFSETFILKWKLPFFYEDFGQRLKQDLPNSIYTKNYFRKLNYYAFEDQSIIPNWIFWIIGLLGIGLLVMSGIAYYFYQKVSVQAKVPIKSTSEQIALLYDKLTLKEREILALIQAGKANKEIASELFIGVSTVKSHINKIYAKLEVHSRKEVVSKLRKL